MGLVTIYLYLGESRKDGKFPVRIRVRQSGKYAFQTLFYIKDTHWNDHAKCVHSYERDSVRMNAELRKRVREVSELVEHYDSNEYPYVAQDILDLDYGRWKEKATLKKATQAKQTPGGFLSYIRTVIVPHWQRMGNLGNADKYELEADIFEDYLKTLKPVRVDVPMASFNNDLVESYFRYLRQKPSPCRKDSTLARKLGQIEAVLNFAHRAGAIDKLPQLSLELNILKSRKPKLTKEQIDQLNNHVWEFPPDQLRRNARKTDQLAVHTFLLQYYLFGARIGDIMLLRNSNITTRNNQPVRVEYYQQKGRKRAGKKLLSIVLKPQVLAILLQYWNPAEPDSFLLPWLRNRWENDPTESEIVNNDNLKYAIHQATSANNKALVRACASIGVDVPRLASHSARHSYAQGAKRKGISIEFIKESFGHSSYNITATYLDDLDMDELNEKLQIVYD